MPLIEWTKELAIARREASAIRNSNAYEKMMCHKFAVRLTLLTAGEDFYDPDPENKYDVNGRIRCPYGK